MKIALVHDYIKEYGGAERVLEALHEIWPSAPIYTTLFSPKHLGPHADRFSDWNIKTSWFQHMPFSMNLISPFRLIAPFVFKSWNFSEFDVVIVSATGAYNPNLIKKGKAIHICYCHTPPRYLYGYPTARKADNTILKPFIHLMNHILRMVDFKSAQNVDYFIANSGEIKERIKKFYRKSATVINPPVSISDGKHGSRSAKKRDYYLAGGRLARAKRIDLAVEACTKLQQSLLIFGNSFAGYGEELIEMAGDTIQFLGEVAEEEKWKLMQDAKAFIFPSEFEDFGITPVEAMAAGTPVIALSSGGVKETVVEGKTGIFFDKPEVDSLIAAIREFEKIKIKSSDCKKQAKKFSKEKFKKRMVKFVEAKVR